MKDISESATWLDNEEPSIWTYSFRLVPPLWTLSPNYLPHSLCSSYSIIVWALRESKVVWISFLKKTYLVVIV
jgi:hypothetical protein